MSRAPLSTDEPLDRFFSRPLAALLVRLVAPTPLTPNGVTAIAACCGLGAGVALVLGEGLWAAGLIAAFLVVDCMDGQLARLRGGGSYLGRAVDGLGDYAAAAGVHVGMAWWMVAQGRPLLETTGLVLLAAASMSWSSFLFDRYKRRYRGDMDDVEAMHVEATALGGMRGRLIESLIPYSRRLDGGVVVPDLAAYQLRTRPAFHLWRLCGPTMHFAVMGLCVAWARPTLYTWLAIGPFTLWTAAALVLQQHLERRPPAAIERVPS